MSLTFKTLEQNLPEEMVQRIAELKSKSLTSALCEEIRSKDKSCFDTASNKLLDMIAGTGTFQEGHFDTHGKRYEVIFERRGGPWSPLDIKVKIISYGKNAERHIEVYQTKEEKDFDFEVETRIRFDPSVIAQTMENFRRNFQN